MRLISLILCAIFALSGCGSDEMSTPIETMPNYFPDAVGSRWVYRNPDGSEWSREVANELATQGDNYRIFAHTLPVSETELDYLRPSSFRVLQNRVSFVIGEKIDGYIQTELPILVQDEFAGLELDIALESTSHPEFVFLQRPLSPNTEWNALNTKVNGSLILQNLVLLQIPFEVDVRINGRVVAEAPVETPVGNFDAAFRIEYKMEITHTLFAKAETIQQDQTVWFVPHVGIVKIENADGVTELIAYTFPRTIEA